MGAMVEEAIEGSVKALLSRSPEVAKGVVERDKEVNEMTGVIEGAALKILLCQQPVASDLRKISTALKLVGEIERIGDQAADICSIVLNMCEEGQQDSDFALIPQMAEIAKTMVHQCIDSFVRTDIELARRVVAMDNEMDELFLKVQRKMIDSIENQPAHVDHAIYLMMIAKYFEKIGDHAENVAAWVIFSVTGSYKDKFLI